LPITNRDGKIIYRGIISLADDLLYVCQLHFVPFRFVSSFYVSFRCISFRFISFRFVSFSFLSLVVPEFNIYLLYLGCTKLRNEIETPTNETKRNEILRNATKYTKRRNETQRNETKFTIMRSEMKWIQRNETNYIKVRNAIERNEI
jgi:hypothetical protein